MCVSLDPGRAVAVVQVGVVVAVEAVVEVE